MDTSEIQIATGIESNIEQFVFPNINARPLRFLGYFIVAIVLPSSALLIYMDYAASHGILLEKGCEGPGVPFSLLSGILFALQLRFFEITKH
jgi:hypothetical protein